MRQTGHGIRAAAIDAALVPIFAAVAAAHVYPLVRRLSTHLPGAGLGDNAGFAWNLWWMRQALGSDQLDFFRTDHLMAPLGAALIQHTHTALTAWLGATILGGVSVVEAQNALLLASVALNGLAAYALTREAGASRAPAFLSGVLFMLAPPLTARLTGHFNFVAAWPLALGCWAALRLIRRPTVSAALALGVTAAATAYAEPYLFVYLALAAAVLLLGTTWSARVTFAAERTRRGNRTALPFTLAVVSAGLFAAGLAIALTGGAELYLRDVEISARRPTNVLIGAWTAALAALVIRTRPRLHVSRAGEATRPVWRHFLGAIAIAGALMWPLARAAWDLWRSGDYVSAARGLKSAPAGVDVATLVMGPPFHGLIGGRVRDVYGRFGIDPLESGAWLGVLPLALALWSFWRFGREPAVRRWALLASVFFVWALGPFLVAFGQNVGLVLPQALVQIVPLLNNARIPGRALIVVSLSLAVLAGLGLQRAGGARPLLAAGLAAAACLELIAAPLALTPVPRFSTAVRWLAGQPEGTVLHLPFGLRDGFGERGRLDHGSLILQFRHGKPLAGGFVARLPSRVEEWYERTEPFGTFLRLSAGEPPGELPSCAEALRGLRSASVRYVVVERRLAPRPAVRFLRSLPVKRAIGDRFREVYVLEDAAGCPSR